MATLFLHLHCRHDVVRRCFIRLRRFAATPCQDFISPRRRFRLMTPRRRYFAASPARARHARWHAPLLRLLRLAMIEVRRAFTQAAISAFDTLSYAAAKAAGMPRYER